MILVIRTLLWLTALVSLSSCYVEGQISVMQGASSADKTQFHIISAENETLAFFYEGEDKQLYQVPDENIVAAFDVLKKYSVYKVKVEKLKPQHQYILNIISKEKEKLIGRKKFFTRRRDTYRRVGILSCAGDFSDRKLINKMWKQLTDLKPDVVVMAGDNVYADVTSLKVPIGIDRDKILQRYFDHRFSLPYYLSDELFPTYATWDDHDYGINNGDRHFELKGSMQEAFHLMYAQDLKGVVEEGPGVSRLVNLGDYQFALLDNRSFRDKEDKKDGDHFGKAQMYWLENSLKNNKPTFVVSGDQFFGEFHKFESFYGHHAKKFKSFMKKMKKSKSLMAFISGDRHMSEMQKLPSKWLGYDSYELTSSPIHSSLYPDRSVDKPNARRIWATSKEVNFMILEVFQANTDLLSLGISFWGENGLIWKSPAKIKK